MQKGEFKYTFQKRLGVITVIISLLVIIISLRFFYLQIFQYDFYKLKASNNSIRTIPIEPARGLIFDRNDKVIAANQLTYNLELNKKSQYDLDELARKLTPIVKITRDDINKYQKILANDPFLDTVAIKTDLTDEEVAAFTANRYLYDGIQLIIRQKRFYSYAQITSHLVGHIHRINKADIKTLQANNKYQRYFASRHMGKTGIESSYEDVIHGYPGYKQIEVNAKNESHSNLSYRSPD